jgi:hypothetical protein
MNQWLVRRLVAGVLLSGAALAASQTNRTGTIAGVVVGVDASATIFLQPVDYNPTSYYDGYKATTESDGRFIFAEIKPGTYRIKAELSGFMPAGSEDDAKSVITLHSGEKRDGIKLTMVRKQAMCGHVTENGLPQKTWVAGERYNPEFGTLTEIPGVATGPDGSYSLPNLAPGSYFLRSDWTWYPGSFNFNGAKPLIVTKDADKQNGIVCLADIPVQNQGCPGHGANISGHIAASQGDENAQYRVNFLETNDAGVSSAVTTSSINNVYKAGDSFKVGLCSGNYDVVLSNNYRISPWRESPSQKVIFDKQNIAVGQVDIDGLVLTPHPMASIAGEIHFENITRREICPGRGGQYVAILREGDGQFQVIDLKNDNHFAFQNVEPGEYQLYIGPVLREAVFIKSLVVDGKPQQGRRFSILQSAPAKMDITLSGDIAHAEGHVSPDVRGEPRWDVASTRPRGSVSGRIESGQSEGLTVKLRAARYNSDGSEEYSVSPATDGTFHFDEVDPGVYTLSVAGKNFLMNEFGALDGGKQGSPIVVTRGAHIEGLTLKPLKLSSVCGQVTDATGTPRPEVQIQIERYQNGYLNETIYLQDRHITDQKGFFRADGFYPGDYFIHYISNMYRGESGGSGFFSNDGSLRAAKALHVVAGKDMGCSPPSPLELKMPLGNRTLYKIAGTTAGNFAPGTGDRFRVSLMDENEDGAQVLAGSSKLDADRNFSVENVPDGRYTLELHSGYGPEPMTWSGPYPPLTHLLARQQIEVQNADILDVKITPMELPIVTGHVHFTDLPESWKGKTFDKTTVWIRLVPRTDQPPLSAQLSSDETFQLGPEDAGEYEVGLQWDFNRQLYIRSIRLNGQPIEGRYLRLRPDERAHLEIEISGQGNEVKFSVLSDASLPTPEPHLTEVCRSSPTSSSDGVEVILLPDPLLTDGSNSASSIEKNVFWAARVSDGDRMWLDVRNVQPGQYRAIAAEHLSSGLFAKLQEVSSEGRALLEALAGLGQPLTVEPNSTQEIALPDKTIDVERLAAKLGLPLGSAVLDAR